MSHHILVQFPTDRDNDFYFRVSYWVDYWVDDTLYPRFNARASV